MKKYLFVTMICSILIISGCGIGNQTNQTSFKVNEVAEIDEYQVTLLHFQTLQEYGDQKPKKGQFIEFVFEIKNKSKQIYKLQAEENFKLYDKNQSLYISILTSNELDIDTGETKTYRLVYDVDYKEKYNILFYSGIVTNNIQFESK